MKRWLSHLTIFAYVGTLFIGIASHALSLSPGAHPLMYFIVWDMFCGWSSYSNRIQLIGEGESGKFYELGPGPWGEYHPYGDIGRRHYDSFGNHLSALAVNCLKHTKHEPIRRIFAIEEYWAKKFNLPDHLWNKLYESPKDRHVYYHIRGVYDGEGRTLQFNQSWLTYQTVMTVANNPRLQADSRKGHPFFAINPALRTDEVLNPTQFQYPQSFSPVGSRLGN